MRSTDTTQIVAGAVGGVAIGYILWLVAISIGEGFATVSRWSPIVLILAGVLAVCAAVWGLLMRRRGKHAWSAFAFGLPILPVVLTLAVLADLYF